VLATVKLHDQFCAGAAEIDDKSIERHLSPKLQAAEPAVAQLEP
jgi:hypothetical protein